jgi:hypothetical protein
MSKIMYVKVKKSFPNPMTNRAAEIDSTIKVPKTQFWLKRLEDGCCEKISKPKKAKAKIEEKLSEKKADVEKNKSKGSK